MPFPLAHGGTAWMLAPGSTGSQPPARAGLIPGHHRTDPARFRRDARRPPGRLPRGHRPAICNSTAPPAISPQQIQTAYGLSNGSAYNNNIAFGAIKGDGAGQTIGIFEEGYNPDFVDTSGSQLRHQRPGGLRQDLRPARPAQPDLRRPDRQPAHGLQSRSPATPFDYGAGLEIALDIEWAHAMAPGPASTSSDAVPDFTH